MGDYRCGDAAIDMEVAQIIEHLGRVRSAAKLATTDVLRRKLLELISFTLRCALDEEAAVESAEADPTQCRSWHDELAAVIWQQMLCFSDGDRDAALVIANAIDAHMVLERRTIRGVLRRPSPRTA